MLYWLRNYRRSMLAGDISAGIVVAIMMVPQGMAYALVAGLPPVVGIYASIVPPILYALFGSSMTQSVGPMAITSLMTAAALAPLAAAGSGLYTVLAAQLAMISGAVLLVCGLLRLGFVLHVGYHVPPVFEDQQLHVEFLVHGLQQGLIRSTELISGSTTRNPRRRK